MNQRAGDRRRKGQAVAEVIAGIHIPDTQLVSDATAFVRDAESDLLYNHSRRVFLFGALQGKRLGIEPDPELLYVGTMFHDLGLTPKHATETRRFEVDSAHVARDFLRDHGVPEDQVAKVFLAISLHTTPNIPQFLDPEVALVTAGVETDVLGFGYDDLDPRLVAEVTDAHPRPDFKARILQAFTEGNVHRPQTTFGNVNADVLERFSSSFERMNFVDIIQNSAWPE
jgi:HD superfamily phosphodiesterase